MRLSTDKLACVRGGRVIFSDLNFEVQGGESLVLLGRNGAGKTSLLRVLAGYLQPSAGRILFDGGDPEADLGEMCHFVGHLNGVKLHFSVEENLQFWAKYLTVDLSAEEETVRIERALTGFGLTDLVDMPAGFLSAGQKRRLCLARLLVADRPLWLLDEPTVSLDAASQSYVAKAVNDHVGGGGIVIAATHIELGLKGARVLELGASAYGGREYGADYGSGEGRN